MLLTSRVTAELQNHHPKTWELNEQNCSFYGYKEPRMGVVGGAETWNGKVPRPREECQLWKGPPTESEGYQPHTGLPSSGHQLKMPQGPRGRGWTDQLQGEGWGGPRAALLSSAVASLSWRHSELSVDLTLISTLARGPLCFQDPTKLAQPSSFSTQAAFLCGCRGLYPQIPNKERLSVLRVSRTPSLAQKATHPTSVVTPIRWAQVLQ